VEQNDEDSGLLDHLPELPTLPNEYPELPTLQEQPPIEKPENDSLFKTANEEFKEESKGLEFDANNKAEFLNVEEPKKQTDESIRLPEEKIRKILSVEDSITSNVTHTSNVTIEGDIAHSAFTDVMRTPQWALATGAVVLQA